jgi:hypothetical protein
MVRVAQRVGIERIAKNITPTLDAYLARKTQEAAE